MSKEKGGDLNQVQSQVSSVGEALQVATQGGDSRAESMQQQAIHGQQADVAAASAGGQGMVFGVGPRFEASTDARLGQANDVGAASGMDEVGPLVAASELFPQAVALGQKSWGVSLSHIKAQIDPTLTKQGKWGVAQTGNLIRVAPDAPQEIPLHELSHTVQQNQPLQLGSEKLDLEQEANQAAHAAMQHKPFKITGSSSAPSLSKNIEGKNTGEILEEDTTFETREKRSHPMECEPCTDEERDQVARDFLEIYLTKEDEEYIKEILADNNNEKKATEYIVEIVKKHTEHRREEPNPQKTGETTNILHDGEENKGILSECHTTAKIIVKLCEHFGISASVETISHSFVLFPSLYDPEIKSDRICAMEHGDDPYNYRNTDNEKLICQPPTDVVDSWKDVDESQKKFQDEELTAARKNEKINQDYNPHIDRNFLQATNYPDVEYTPEYQRIFLAERIIAASDFRDAEIYIFNKVNPDLIDESKLIKYDQLSRIMTERGPIDSPEDIRDNFCSPVQIDMRHIIKGMDISLLENAINFFGYNHYIKEIEEFFNDQIFTEIYYRGNESRDFIEKHILSDNAPTNQNEAKIAIKNYTVYKYAMEKARKRSRERGIEEEKKKGYEQ